MRLGAPFSKSISKLRFRSGLHTYDDLSASACLIWAGLCEEVSKLLSQTSLNTSMRQNAVPRCFARVASFEKSPKGAAK